MAANLKIDLFHGQAAAELMADTHFAVEWRRLYASCPWATIFQDFPFARVWYESYRSRFTPLIVTGRKNRDLAGLLLLAISRDGATLCHAGAHHAEYPVWIDVDEVFLEAALDTLAAQYPQHTLRFVFLPPGVRFRPGDRWKKRCFLRAIPQPLMVSTPADGVRESLRKKSNKSKWNRLNRLGTVTVDRVTNEEEFSALLEETGPLCDLRLGALYDTRPFESDPLKKPFYIALMRETDLLHVTAMRLDGRLVAVHIGMRNNNQVLVGILAHSPCFSEHSVGKFLLLHLGLLLEQEGIGALDLTPSGEYKDRFASRFEEAYVLTVFFNPVAARRYRWRRYLVEWVKRQGFLNRNRTKFEAAIRLVRDFPRKLLAAPRQRLFFDEELVIYMIHRKAVVAPAVSSGPHLHRDCFADLLLYRASGAARRSRQDFLRSALENLEGGSHAYTWVEEGWLRHCSWLGQRPGEGRFPLPENALQLWDEEDLPTGSSALRLASIHTRVAHAFQSSAEAVFIETLASDAETLRNIEAAGFARYGSLLIQYRWGRKTNRWSPAPGS